MATTFDRTFADAPPYTDPTAATMLTSVNTGGAVWHDRATGRAMLIDPTAGPSRFPVADAAQSLAALVALGLLRACGEAEAGVDCYEGTGERVARFAELK